jgi:hypothetical protein
VPVRRLQLLGLVVLALCAFWPAYHFRAYPVRGALPQYAEAAPVGFYVADTRQVPAHEIGRALLAGVRGPERGVALWDARPWYPYVLVPLWLLALLLAGRPGDPARHGRRRGVGAVLVLLATGVALLEAFYLRADYESFLPGRLGVAESLGAWFLILAMLFYRRRPDRHLGAVEAGVAAQALLAFVHLLTLPSTMARPWIGTYELGAVARAIGLNFLPAFWVGCAGMLLVALPVYLRRASGVRP